MTTEQKNYLLVARFYLEHRNDPAGLELWLKRRRQNPISIFHESPPELAFIRGFNWDQTKEREGFWSDVDDEYRAWYDSLPERHTDQIRDAIKKVAEQCGVNSESIPIFKKEPDNAGGIVSAYVINASDIEKPLPAEFAEWLASVEAKNPEHARFFRENFSQREWDLYAEIEPHPGVRGVDPKVSTHLLTVYKDSGNVWEDLRNHYPYPIPAPREISFTPEEATEGRFLVDVEGGSNEILFTNGKIWVIKRDEGTASRNFTWLEIADRFISLFE